MVCIIWRSYERDSMVFWGAGPICSHKICVKKWLIDNLISWLVVTQNLWKHRMRQHPHHRSEHWFRNSSEQFFIYFSAPPAGRIHLYLTVYLHCRLTSMLCTWNRSSVISFEPITMSVTNMPCNRYLSSASKWTYLPPKHMTKCKSKILAGSPVPNSMIKVLSEFIKMTFHIYFCSLIQYRPEYIIYTYQTCHIFSTNLLSQLPNYNVWMKVRQLNSFITFIDLFNQRLSCLQNMYSDGV